MALSTSSSAPGLPRNPLEEFGKTSEGRTSDSVQLLGTERGGLASLLWPHPEYSRKNLLRKLVGLLQCLCMQMKHCRYIKLQPMIYVHPEISFLLFKVQIYTPCSPPNKVFVHKLFH